LSFVPAVRRRTRCVVGRRRIRLRDHDHDADDDRQRERDHSDDDHAEEAQGGRLEERLVHVISLVAWCGR
jgi:hypothetical protein